MEWIEIVENANIPTDDWLLGVIDWNEPFKPASVRLVYWDDIRREWRTQHGRLKDHWQVTHWMPLPELPTD